METNYKLKSNIREFIIAQARERPELGCRKTALLVQERFGITISKSSINTILKSAGLSMPVGRRRLRDNNGAILSPQEYKPAVDKPLLLIPEKIHPLISHKVTSIVNPPEESADVSESSSMVAMKASEGAPLVPGAGYWFLKAADLCLGGIEEISRIINQFVGEFSLLELIRRNESLLYASLFVNPCSTDEVSEYCEKLSAIEALTPALLSKLSAQCREISWLKFILDDESCFFMDAACHSIWPSARIPGYFSASLRKVKDCVNKSFVSGAQPLILQSPPGFKTPSAAFLSFLASSQPEDSRGQIKRIELYTIQGELVDAYQIASPCTRDFIVGLWPWQYAEFQQSLAAGPLAFTHPQREQKIVVRRVALRRENKDIITLLTNIKEDSLADEKIRLLYSERWPNFEIGYQDFLGKIEIAHASDKGAPEACARKSLPPGKGAGMAEVVEYWRGELHGYCQRHFFPLSYRGADFITCKERFYALKGMVKNEEGCCKVIFEPSRGPAHTAELLYSCQRANESDIYLPGGEKLLFGVSP